MRPIHTGDVVGDYRVIDIAGSGGMGAVYKIEHIITRRVEAMKLLPPGSSSDPEQVQRFEREIQVQARLHHPNIVELYNAVREGNSIALVMEFVEGESLQHMLEAGPLPVETAVNFTCQVLRALAYAHEAGVIHRDVSPANIIITRDRVAKLTDFGLARGATDLRLSTSGVPLGSPWYMSPEQVRGNGTLDGRTDLYAMGAVLHEMLTGGKLFEVEGAFAVMRAQVEAVPVPPSARNPRVPPAIDEIVRKALAKDRAHAIPIGGRIPAGIAECGRRRGCRSGAFESSGNGTRYRSASTCETARASRVACGRVDGAGADRARGRLLCDSLLSDGRGTRAGNGEQATSGGDRHARGGAGCAGRCGAS